jgi:hypothetical protein
MSILAVALTLVLLAAVIVVVSGPLRATRPPADSLAPERAELEAAREAKYREIRDAELDYRTGKLSRQDYEAVNGALRAEAVAILHRLDALREHVGDSGVRTSEGQGPGRSQGADVQAEQGVDVQAEQSADVAEQGADVQGEQAERQEAAQSPPK